jgi:hypothetical protein
MERVFQMGIILVLNEKKVELLPQPNIEMENG